MKIYFLAEKLKYRHTSLKGLTIGMPLASVLLAMWLTHDYFAVSSYNWWYIGLYPCLIGILCGMIGEKDKKKKNLTIGSLPCNMGKIWDAKILLGTVLSGAAMLCVVIFTMIAVSVLENELNQTIIALPSVKVQLTAGLVIWLSSLWQIPFCLLFVQKMGMFLMLLIHMGSYSILAVTASLTPWFAFFPEAITARLMCPVLGVLPNGLPAVEGQMTYLPELMEIQNIWIGVPASIFWFWLFWKGSRKHFQKVLSENVF
ncbi:MAG: lantibiotic immunity ABC transporter MutE/EpiE family permease subunit [Lachnospiraceae bacterium]|nr:lantibiotic immunity ABC transporter MutE/EpiE family permease subunit [Lachnospiraceae bacterium]